MKNYKLLYITFLFLFLFRGCNINNKNDNKSQDELNIEIYNWKLKQYKNYIKALPQLSNIDISTWENRFDVKSKLNIVKKDFNLDGFEDAYLSYDLANGFNLNIDDNAIYIYSKDAHYYVKDNFSKIILKKAIQYFKDKNIYDFEDIVLTYFFTDNNINGQFYLVSKIKKKEFLIFNYTYDLYSDSFKSVKFHERIE